MSNDIGYAHCRASQQSYLPANSLTTPIFTKVEHANMAACTQVAGWA
jgi:hypothetical protein